MKGRPFSQRIPPWANAYNHRCIYWISLCVACICSAALYFPQLKAAHDSLYTLGDHPVLRPDQTMYDFVEIASSQGDVGGWYSQPVLAPFALLALGAVVLAVYNYTGLWRGAKTRYLMARLPDRWELHRRCLTLPLALLLTAVVLSALVLLAYYAIYLLITPQECLRPHQLAKVWENLRFFLNPFYHHPGGG